MHYPKMIKIRQTLDSERIGDAFSTVTTELQLKQLSSRISPGSHVAIAAGSRGINNIAEIMSAIAQQVKQAGGVPFIVPAMGSHGGATAEGQADVLRGFGITEDHVDIPIRSSMKTVKLGETESGIPVMIDKTAYAADHIIVVNRIKPHTEFQGQIESGLVKMIVIGLGKHQGAISAHNYAVKFGYEKTIIEIGRYVLTHAPICLGVGIIENGYGETARIQVLEPREFIEAEKALLDIARQKIPRLPFGEMDILIVDECGKEISGTGMDTKVIGRIRNVYELEVTSPKITRIILRSLTENTHGNAIGVGLADFVTKRVADAIDFRASYINSITAVTPEKASLPIVCQNDKEALDFAIATSGPVDADKLKVVRIRNTSKLGEMFISEGLLPAVKDMEMITIIGQPIDVTFDAAGDFQF